MASALNTLFRYRGLVQSLLARELKARYRGTLLGFFWSLVNPLILLAVYSFVFGYVFRPRVPEGASTDPYALFLVTGLFPWVWASSSLLEGCVSLSANSGMIRKAVFPLEVLPVVAVLSNLVHFLLAVPILVMALVVGRSMGYETLGWASPLALAVILLELVMLSGIALGLAALHVHFKDTRDLLANALQLLFFMAPILYSLAAIPPVIRRLVLLNPFTPFTLAYQDSLFFGEVPALALWLHMAALAAISWTLGALLFSRLSETLAEAV